MFTYVKTCERGRAKDFEQWSRVYNAVRYNAFSPWTPCTHIVIYVRGMLSLLFAIIFQVLRRDLARSLRRKRPGIDMDTVIFHQDNAPPHQAEVTQLELDVMGFQQLAHSPYSSDLAPMDFPST